MNENNQSDESLQGVSAFMDGESDTDSEACLESLLKDARLREAWGRYHLIGDGLRQQAAAFLRPGTGGGGARHGLRPRTTWVMTAVLVFGAALLGWQLAGQQFRSAPVTQDSDPLSESLTGAPATGTAGSAPGRLEHYALSHSTYLARQEGRGSWSYIHLVVGGDDPQPARCLACR